MTRTKNFQNRLIVSPHSDDALLSLGGTILIKQSFDVLNIFSTCTCSILPNLKDSTEITYINNNEEKLALKKANVSLKFCRINEALLRDYSHWYGSVDYTKDFGIFRQIKKIIIKDIFKFNEIYFPLAIGGHIDHQLIFDIFLELKNEGYLKRKTIYLFEDLPYAISSNVIQRLEIVEKYFNVKKILINISPVIDKKCSLLSIYKSQLTPNDIFAVKNYAQLIGPRKKYYERLWKIR